MCALASAALRPWVFFALLISLTSACAPEATKSSPSTLPPQAEAEPTTDEVDTLDEPAAAAPAIVMQQPSPPPAVEPTEEATQPSAQAAPKPAKAERRRANRESSISGVGEGDVGLSSLGTIGHGPGGGGSGHGRYGQGAGGLSMRMKAAAPAMNIQPSREAYAHIEESGFVLVKDSPLSTFSIDVDTASYSNVRRMLREGQLPPADAVRIEEMINYFDYEDAPPTGNTPIALHTEVTQAPWAPEHRLVRIALRAREMQQEVEAAHNLVFLVDVSGSMQSEDKLPLLKSGLKLLARNLRPQDSLAVVVYAGSSGLALPATKGSHQAEILGALDQLEAGGSTNGAEGIELAYRVAQQQFVKGGVNRVILATDGDFNVGVTSEGELVRLIEQKRKSGIFLTVLGFGTGNLQDSTMEALADKGNGNYAYIDSIAEAHKVLVREAGSTLVTVAKDVKIQVEWNPVHVESYRLIGYENRKLADRDFADDKKDAGEMGAGHRVTALYDVTLRDAAPPSSEVGALRYQGDRALTAQADSDEMLTLKVRYKAPEGSTSELLTTNVGSTAKPLSSGSADLRLSAAVAGFGMLLRGSAYKGAVTLAMVRELARSATSVTARERMELLDLIDAAGKLGLGRSNNPVAIAK